MTTTTSSMVEAARELRPLISELAPRIEAERRLPDELLALMHDAGMFRMFLPKEVGGPELDPWTAFEVVEQLSMEDASAGWLAMILSMSAYTAAFLPEQSVRQVFANPYDVLAGSLMGDSNAQIRDGGVVISGRFRYASGCLHSTWLTAVVADPRHHTEGPAPRLAAVVPVSDCTIVDVWNTTGLRGTSSNDWTVEEVFVPWEQTFTFLPQTSDGFADGPMYRHPGLSLAGIPHCAVQLGTARGALDGYVAMVDQRVRRGIPLKEDPAVQSSIGRADALIASGREFIKAVTEEVWQTETSGQKASLEQHARLRSAKTLAMTNASEAVDLVYEAMGSPAIMDSNPVERRFRDVHAAMAHGQSSRKGFTVAGAVLLGIDPRPSPLLG